MFWTTVRDALASLWSSKQRTFLATIGIVIGSGAVIAMINVGQIVQAEALAQFEKMGPNTITLSAYGDGASITLRTIEALIDEVPGIEMAAPGINSYGSWYFKGTEGSAQVLGTTQAAFEIAGTRLAAGRYIDDLDSSNTYALVGSLALMSPEGRPVPIEVGEKIRVGNSSFTVVGILAPYGNNPLLGIDLDRTLFVPLMATRRLGNGASIDFAMIKVADDADVSRVGGQTEAFLREAVPNLDIHVQVAEQLIESMKQQARLLSFLLGTMGSISLLVGGIGIMNVMLVSVTERRREIGLRLAVGATPGNIVSLFMVESALLTTIGGLLGLGLGAGGAYAASQLTDLPYFFSTIAAVLGVGVSAAVGLFFGYYPAYLASRLNPIDGLNAE